MPWIEQVPAVLQAWYPGQRGGEAIARILFGDVNPGGRLPISLPRTIDQLPRPKPVEPAGGLSNSASNTGEGDAAKLPVWDVDYTEGANIGYRWYAAKNDKPLFPFGYGLSYTRFAFSGATFAGGATPGVTFTVRNTGKRAGAVVPQLYVTAPDGAPLRLAGWKRQWLEPGQSARVTLNADPHALARWRSGGWSVAAGSYRLALAQDAEHVAAAGTVAIPATMLQK
jgi:beta-glucosidase